MAGLLLALLLARLPIALDFKLFAFYDQGSALRADRLVAGGLVPTVDFGFSYGLLPLALGRAWFTLFGRTPTAYWLFMTVGMAGMVWGLVRFGHAMNFGRAGWVLLAVTLPYAIPASYLHLTHPVEACLLIHALADVAADSHGRSGRWGGKPRALALVTAAAFAKPSMAYVAGFFLTVWLAIDGLRRRPEGGLARAVTPFLPAAAVGIALGLAMAGLFGAEAVNNTLLPLTGAKSYKAAHFGFFTGIGQTFWRPSSPSLVYYLFTEAGFWLAASLLVVAGAAAAAVRGALRKTVPAGAGVLAVLAALHVVFVCAFFAWQGSWVYYSYLLMMAVAALPTVFRPAPRWAFGTGVVVAVLGLGYQWGMVTAEWAFKDRPPALGRLWIYADQRGRWEDLLAQLRAVEGAGGSGKAYVLGNGDLAGMQGVAEAGPGGRFEMPPSWFLSPALPTPREVERINADLRRAPAVVRFKELGDLDPFLFPEFQPELAAFQLDWENDWFMLYTRQPGRGLR
jgi:hypothetical protein